MEKILQNEKKVYTDEERRYFASKIIIEENLNVLNKGEDGLYPEEANQLALNYLYNVRPEDYTKFMKEKNKEIKKENKRYEKDKKKQLKSDFLDFIKDKKKDTATEIMVDYIKEKNYIYTTKDDEKSEIWIYRDGIYTPNGKSEIKIIIRDILGKWYNIFHFNSIINKIEADTFIDRDKLFNQDILEEIPVQNGILNIFTRQLSQFNPKKIFFNKLPVEYISEAKCPLIDKFLKEVLANEEDINVIYELGGFTLLKEYRFEKAFMFVGDGRNGKDKTLELIKRVIGIENCCSVPLSSLDLESFIMSEFFKKFANLSGEISNRDLKETEVFKHLTGRSLITAPRKFLHPITFLNYAKFIFACNELPMVYDTSRGFWDRWVLLEFPYTFVPFNEFKDQKDKNPFIKLRDETIIDKITTSEELSGCLNRFLEGLDRLLQNKEFSQTLGCEAIKTLWVRKANSFTAFCMDFIEFDEESYLTKKELRKEYQKYCKKYKLMGKNDMVIKRVLEELFGVVEEWRGTGGIDQERCWIGLKWKEKNKDTKTQGFYTYINTNECVYKVEKGVTPVSNLILKKDEYNMQICLKLLSEHTPKIGKLLPIQELSSFLTDEQISSIPELVKQGKVFEPKEGYIQLLENI